MIFLFGKIQLDWLTRFQKILRNSSANLFGFPWSFLGRFERNELPEGIVSEQQNTSWFCTSVLNIQFGPILQNAQFSFGRSMIEKAHYKRLESGNLNGYHRTHDASGKVNTSTWRPSRVTRSHFSISLFQLNIVLFGQSTRILFVPNCGYEIAV